MPNLPSNSNRRIARLIDCPHLIPEVVEQIRAQWPNARDATAVEQRLCGNRDPGNFPAALVLLEGEGPSARWVGFVSLVLFEKGIAQGRPHWIDALYVEPALRGRGLAQLLILAAEDFAASLGATRLFALTELPPVYEKAGWTVREKISEKSPEDVIMTKPLRFTLVKKYFELLETFVVAPAAFAPYLHPEFKQSELPNLLNKAGQESDLASALQRAAVGAKILASQKFEIVNHFSADEQMVVEAKWKGTMAVDAGSLRAGQTLRAHFCVVLEFRDDKIYRQRNYDCFEPF